jgi:hypothetical protein
MTYLSKTDNDLIQCYLESTKTKLDAMGLRLTIGRDLTKCRAAYNKIPGHIVFPNTHDPERVYCHPDNAFWIAFECKQLDRPVVLAAHRMIETRSLIADMYTHRAFADLMPVDNAYDIGLQDGLPELAGRLGTTGGIVTHDSWRRLGLGGLIARMVQALSMRRFEIDYQYSFTIDDPDRARFVKNGYGIEQSVLATVGKTPINGKTIGVRLNWSSRRQLLDRMCGELREEEAGRLKRAVGVSNPANRAIRAGEGHHATGISAP